MWIHGGEPPRVQDAYSATYLDASLLLSLALGTREILRSDCGQIQLRFLAMYNVVMLLETVPFLELCKSIIIGVPHYLCENSRKEPTLATCQAERTPIFVDSLVGSNNVGINVNPKISLLIAP